MPIYTIRYQYATYSGTRTVRADDEDQALAIVKKWVNAKAVYPMAYESYRIERESTRS